MSVQTSSLSRPGDRDVARAALDVVLCLYVLLPTNRIKSLGQGVDLLNAKLDATDPATDAYGRLTSTYDDLWTLNRPHVQRLGRVFRMASAAIVLEVVLWALQLALS
jgi:hypothetical protein